MSKILKNFFKAFYYEFKVCFRLLEHDYYIFLTMHLLRIFGRKFTLFRIIFYFFIIVSDIFFMYIL